MLSEDNSVKMIHSKHQQSVHQQHQQQNMRKSVGVMGTRRIFPTVFKIKVLDSYRHDKDCRQNQRATARKYGIHRRQIQKWLQCEEQLRSSVENGNTGTVSSETISSASVSKSDSTMTEATGNTVTPATPALNLNLARQHGDELTTQQGPPPSHPPHGSAPSSPQYSVQTTTTETVLPLCLTSVDYIHQNQEYSSERRFNKQLRLLEELDRPRVPKVHGYSDTQVDQECNYYIWNKDGQRDAEADSTFNARNEMKVYQTLTSYHLPHQENRYNVNDNSAHNHSPNHSQQREQSYGNVDSFDGRSYGLLLAPSMIKTEPASPDTAATSGPYESTGSSDGPRAPLSSVSHRSADSGGSSSSVHFVDSSRAPASSYLHVHVHEHAHTCPPPDSEKPIPSLLHKQEKESEETTQRTEEKREKEIQEKIECCRVLIKEEVDLDDEEVYDEREEAIASSCIDYQRPPVGGSPPDQFRTNSGSVSPPYDCNGYSLPSSPPDSAGRSRNNWSDSEVDPLLLPTSVNSSNFTRRRSFPLRFKFNVINAFYCDKEVKENQRATARKFNINRRQVQKWLEQESEIRREIALRENSSIKVHQQLRPVQEVVSGDSPLDLTTSYASLRQVSNCGSLLRDRLETEHEQLPTHFGCDVGIISSQHPPNFQHCTVIESSSEIESVAPCSLSCSADSHTTMSTTSSYQDLSLRESCYTEPSIKTYSYSSRANSVVSNFSEGCEQRFSPLKRQHCMLSCCYDTIPSPKRFCEKSSDIDDFYDVPSQDEPLCLVKPKLTSTNHDAITFKPYLDNPVSKPIKKCVVQHDLSINSHNINYNNNSNCQIICNFNESQNHNYDFELNLRVPWRADLYTGFPPVVSASLYM